MDRQRLAILKSEFDEVFGMLKRAEDAKERHIWLKQLRRIITEADVMIQRAQKNLRTMKDRLRLL